MADPTDSITITQPTVSEATAKEILEDSGYQSRKLWALGVFFLLMTLVAVAAIDWDGKHAARAASALAVLMPYGGLLGGGLAAYYGVNWGHSFLAGRAAKAADETEK